MFISTFCFYVLPIYIFVSSLQTCNDGRWAT